jgi:hypothetical protein
VPGWPASGHAGPTADPTEREINCMNLSNSPQALPSSPQNESKRRYAKKNKKLTHSTFQLKSLTVNSSIATDETIEEEGIFTPKNTNAFLRGEKRSVCKNCGMPAVGLENPDELTCFSKECDGRGRDSIISVG